MKETFLKNITLFAFIVSVLQSNLNVLALTNDDGNKNIYTVIIKNNIRYGAINNVGKELFSINVSNLGQFFEGFAIYHHKNKFGYIDSLGHSTIFHEYDSAQNFSEGLALVSVGKRFYFIDKKGNKILKTPYFPPFTMPCSCKYSEGLVGITLREVPFQMGYFDKKGKMIFQLPERYVGGGFSEGFAPVRVSLKNGYAYKFGYIDKSGNIIIPLIYDTALPFSEGIGMVRENKNYKGIDRHGKELFKITADECWPFSDGLSKVSVNQKIGFINPKGQIVIIPQFDWACSFYNGRALVEIKKDTLKSLIKLRDKESMYGYIDKTGKMVIPAIFESASNFDGDLAEVRLNGKQCYIDKNGKIIWKQPD